MIQACAAWIVERFSRVMMHSAHVCSQWPTPASKSSHTQMLSVLKRLASAPHLEHSAWEPLAAPGEPLAAPGSPTERERDPDVGPAPG